MNIFDTSVGASIQAYYNSVIESARKLPTFLRSENVRKLTSYGDAMMSDLINGVSATHDAKTKSISKIISTTYCAEMAIKSLSTAGFLNRQTYRLLISKVAEIRRECEKWKNRTQKK